MFAVKDIIGEVCVAILYLFAIVFIFPLVAIHNGMKRMDNKFRKYLDPFEVRRGHWLVEVSVPITKIIDWISKKESKAADELVWVYEGCDCMPTEGSRSIPYCKEHYNPLIRKKNETKTKTS